MKTWKEVRKELEEDFTEEELLEIELEKQKILATIDPFYSEKNIKELKKSIKQLKENKVVKKSMKELKSKYELE